MADDRRVLFDRYRLVDLAVKVVGVGSVGTLCVVFLMVAIDDPRFPADQGGRAPCLRLSGESAYANQGERVVQGQRLMQPASDLFLGWAQDRRAATSTCASSAT